jgi:hypothetical protein
VVSLPTWLTVALLHESLAVGAVKVGLAGHSMVALAPAAPIVGAVMSRTVMVCVTVPLVLPQALVARQALVSVYVPEQVPLTVVSLPTCATVGLPPHASEAVGVVNTGTVGQLMVLLLTVPIVGLHAQPPGFSAIKIAAHALRPPEGFLVADPAPVVEPADVFMPHPALTCALVSKTSPYISLRAPGDVAVVNDPVAMPPGLPGLEANITIAALAVALVIAVTADGSTTSCPFPVV